VKTSVRSPLCRLLQDVVVWTLLHFCWPTVLTLSCQHSKRTRFAFREQLKKDATGRRISNPIYFNFYMREKIYSSSISVAAAHGQRVCLRKLLSHPLAPGSREVLSLEEMLAEGDNTTRAPIERSSETPPALNKTQIKSLQEAMYHSAENNHLGKVYCCLRCVRIKANSKRLFLTDITIELRALGVPWTLHCWMHALAAAHELRLDAVIDQLLQDFLQVCPDDYSQQFVSECLPLLFNIFRYSKVSYSSSGVQERNTNFIVFFCRKRALHFFWRIYSARVLVGSRLKQSKNQFCCRSMDHVLILNL
jgi:hypothetical protein